MNTGRPFAATLKWAVTIAADIDRKEALGNHCPAACGQCLPGPRRPPWRLNGQPMMSDKPHAKEPTDDNELCDCGHCCRRDGIECEAWGMVFCRDGCLETHLCEAENG